MNAMGQLKMMGRLTDTKWLLDSCFGFQIKESDFSAWTIKCRWLFFS